LRIREAGPADFEPWLAIHEAVAGESRWIGAELPLDPADMRDRFDRALADDQAVLLLAQPAEGGGGGGAGAAGGGAGGGGGAGAAGAAGGGAGAGEGAGAIVGYLRIHVAPYGVADLGMAVADGWRGQGVGSALLAAAIDWARAHGAHKVALQLWPHNTAAQALYEKFGFVVEGRLRRHYPRRNRERWDAVIMGLLLDDPP
jgi:ribosomal protein S18 acetylase RimI-like enzyme